LLTRGGNRADDIGSGKLGTRSALELRCFGTGNLGSDVQLRN
jgi:hypothetical protein